jgi:N6-L-threonylcarbamoyladenine synthase
LRAQLLAACTSSQIALRVADRAFCTDNAAMIGILAARRRQLSSQTSSLDADIQPGWILGEPAKN